MAIRVGVSGTTIKSVAVAGSTTQVKRVVVGTPVKRVSAVGNTIETLNDVDISQRTNGSILIYNTTTGKWTASTDLEEQNINGGSY